MRLSLSLCENFRWFVGQLILVYGTVSRKDNNNKRKEGGRGEKKKGGNSTTEIYRKTIAVYQYKVKRTQVCTI